MPHHAHKCHSGKILKSRRLILDAGIPVPLQLFTVHQTEIEGEQECYSMTRKITEIAISEAEKCTAHYWKGEWSYLFTYMTDDILYESATTGRLIRGKEKLQALARSRRFTFSRAEPMLQTYHCVYDCRELCVLGGHYLVSTKKEGRELFHEEIYITGVWRREEGKPKLCCIRVIGPVRYDPDIGTYFKDDRLFLHDYMEHRIKQLRRESRKLSYRCKDFLLLLSEDEIESAEAKKHETELTTIFGVFLIQVPWNKFLDTLGPDFLLVHRSYVINKKRTRIFSESKNLITMESGKEIPVSERRHTEVYNSLTHDHDAGH